MMLMGVLLHSGVMYMPMPYGADVSGVLADATDPYRDISGYSVAVQRIVITIHIFRMPAFMLLAGFFGSMLIQKRGDASFWRNRCRRIVIPMTLFWLVLWPMDRFGWQFGGAMLQDAGAATPGWDHFVATFHGELLPFRGDVAPHTMHLWFIYYLIYFYAITYFLQRALSMLAPGALAAAQRSLTQLGASPAAWLVMPVLIGVTYAVLSSNGVTHFLVSFDFLPNLLTALPYYLFFLCGWICYHHRGVIDFAARMFWPLMPVSLALLVANIYFGEQAWIAQVEQMNSADASAQPTAELVHLTTLATWLQSCSVWFISLTLIGMCHRWITRPSPKLTFLVGASYWLYLVHRPMCTMFAAMLQRWQMPGLLKFAIGCAAVTTVCLVTYQFFVRRTVIGVLLNGRRS
jgi:glucan biosynthesis protein C